MLKTRELDNFLADFLKKQEQLRRGDEKATMYKILRVANTIYSPEDPDDFCDEAVEAAGAFLMYEINQMAIAATRKMAELLLRITEMPDTVTADAVKELKKLKDDAAAGYLFTTEITKSALADIDTEWLVEVLIDNAKNTEEDDSE
jgi:hypothetical protein